MSGISTTVKHPRSESVSSRSSASSRIGYGVLYAILGLTALLQVLPLVWLLLFSLKNNQEIFNLSPFALPKQLHWSNYSTVWSQGSIGRYFVNSLWITGVSVALTILFANFVTFAMTRMKWKLHKAALGLFMIAMMIPVHSTLIPLFSMFKQVHLTDSQWSIVLSYIAFNLPLTIMILIGFYYALPREVEEAAIMDGCSVNRMFFRIILPMTVSVSVTAAIINMIYNWNEFIFVNTFLSSESKKTLTVGIQNFVGQYTTNWGAIGATLMISILPILVIFFVLSNRIVEGIAAGSVKG